MMPEATVATVIWAVGSLASMSAAPATNTDAPPPKPFSSATICGIAVISILRASVAPIPPPMTTPARITTNPCMPAPKTSRLTSVATTASSMPVAP